MNSSLPTALILGINHFVAKKLAAKILSHDINVIGVGEYVSELTQMNNLIIKNDLSEVIENEYNYIFDFEGSGDLWNKAVADGTKFVMVCVNDREKSDYLSEAIIKFGGSWRFVESYGVYGPGMDEKGFLAGAFRQAVENKNLILPSLSNNYRLISVDDLVEAILRTVFLSGTEKEKFLIVGDKTNSEEVAKELIDQAKMTRFKVMQTEIQTDQWSDDEVEKNRRKLRWNPIINFSEGIKETLQFFFSKIDEEKRKNKDLNEFEKKKAVLVNKINNVIENKESNNKRRFEVVIEEKEEEFEKIELNDFVEVEREEKESLWQKKEEIKEVEKAPVVEEEKFEEIMPLKHFVKKEIVENKKEVIEEEDDELIEQENTKIEEIKTQEQVLLIKDKKKISFNFGIKDKSTGGLFKKIIIGTLIFVLLIPVYSGFGLYLSVNGVKKVEKLILQKKYQDAELLINKNINRIKSKDNNVDDMGLNKLVIGRNYQNVLRVLGDVYSLELKGLELMKIGDDFSGAVFKEKEIDWYKNLDLAKSKIDGVITDMGIVQARLNGNWSWLPGLWRSKLQKESRQLSEIRTQLEISRKAINIIPGMLGVDGQQKDYLVLFQNESEIRANGGFIGSYGILSFKAGRLINLEIKDVYEADGQLKGHVEPPEEIKKYLGEASWYMRDANWQANFLASSKDIQWFFEKEMNRKVDGVIGIDLSVVKAMLGVVGEISVPDFKEKINKDNLYEQAEFYSETKFFPGSNQKASFLGGLGRQLFEEIKIMNTDQQGKMLVAILDQLERNDLQMAINNKDVSRVISDLGWDGAIYQGKCSKDRCFSDYLYIVESNFGVNKANYFLIRNIEQMVDITMTAVNRTLKINYENTAKSTSWPGGDYKNYIRIYLPNDVNLQQVSLIDGEDLNSRKVYMSDELKIRDVDGKKEVGFLAIVPVSKKRIIEVKYSNSIDLVTKDKFSYLHYIQRQAGYGDTGFVSLVTFPNGWQPLQVQPAASVVGGKLLFNQKLDRDLKMGVELGK